MNTALIPFAYQDCLVRSVMRHGEPWFVGKDVCGALELKNPRTSLALLDDDEKGVHTVDTPGGPQEMVIISEAGVYRLVFTSRKAEAEAFKRWLAHEVLPALRRAGSYSLPGAAVPAQRERAKDLEHLIRFDDENVPEGLASAIATMPVWSNGRRPNFWSDFEVREVLTAAHWQVTMDQVRALCASKFGAARAPSRSAIARYWQVLDLARGIGPAPRSGKRIARKH